MSGLPSWGMTPALLVRLHPNLAMFTDDELDKTIRDALVARGAGAVGQSIVGGGPGRPPIVWIATNVCGAASPRSATRGIITARPKCQAGSTLARHY